MMPEPETRVAILLHAMGNEVVDAALGEIAGGRATKIRQLVADFETQPPGSQQQDEVLDDFEKFFRFAVETANVPSTWMTAELEKHAEQNSHGHGEEAEEDLEPAPPKLKIFQPTDDPYRDLRRLKPFQIAGALKNEYPKTIALVLSYLEDDVTSRVIQELPEQIQSAVFLQMKAKHHAPTELVERILMETVKIGALIESEQKKQPDMNRRLADLLRSMPKKKRAQIMEDIRVQDAETAEAISSLLYVFEDIITLDDRSIQKLLGEIDTPTLVVALQDTDGEFRERLLGNLSKRARGSLEEEMQLSSAKSEEEVSATRNSIAAIIARLDQEGQLTNI